MTRRDWLFLATQAALAAQEKPRSDTEQRIARVIREYEQQGIHRTATAVDNASGDWLENQVRDAGLSASRETFAINRIDLTTNVLRAGTYQVEGVPLFEGSFTDAEGVTGRLGPLASDAPIGLIEIAPNTAGAGSLGEARRQNRHRAIVAVTRGGRPGLCPSNAENFLHPLGPPVLQVSSVESQSLTALAQDGKDVTVIAQVSRREADAFNVIAKIAGLSADAPLVIMTPRSGWWTCASERGGGIACWLELMRALHSTKPARDILFVASTGHELGQLGIEIFAERRPDLIKHAGAWIHFGANIGAAQGPANHIQASDDEMESMMSVKFAAAGIAIARRVSRGTVPGGEAGVVHRGGGRYMSLIGGNALFHNPADHGPEAVDPRAIANFAGVFTAIAREVAS